MKKFEIEKIENLGQKKSEVEEVRETFWYLFFIEYFLIKRKMSADIQRFNMFHSRKRTAERTKMGPLKVGAGQKNIAIAHKKGPVS